MNTGPASAAICQSIQRVKEVDSTPTGASSEETEDKQCLSTIWHKQKRIQIYIWPKMANNCEQRLHALNIDARNLNLCDFS